MAGGRAVHGRAAVAGMDARSCAAAPPDPIRLPTFSLPWAPSVNRYWVPARHSNGTRLTISREARAYHTTAAADLMVQHVQRLALRQCSVVLNVWEPDRRRRDLDNLLKVVLDVLARMRVILDDAEVNDLHIKRCGYSVGGVILVTVVGTP